MEPITLERLAANWSAGMLGGSLAFTPDMIERPDLVDDYVERQKALIKEQSQSAAKAWARRNGRTNESVTAADVARMAACLARNIADARQCQADADREVTEQFTEPQ